MRYFASVQEAADWIFGARYASAKNGLENTRALLRALGDPQRALRFIHVAGTNGKGSVCAMLERMLRACGLKTGLYTSPHLMRFNERIRVNGVSVSDDALIETAERVREATEKLLDCDVRPTFFELTTAIAFLLFQAANVDVVVLETGLGGRLDATNVVSPDLCLITPIGMDHMRQLGDTPEKIAFEKAGIIKPLVPVAVADQLPGVRRVFEDVCRERNAPLTAMWRSETRIISEDRRGSTVSAFGLTGRIALPGHHQAENALLALAGIRLFASRDARVNLDLAVSALPETIWPARLEWIGDRVLLDGAHNPQGARSLAEYVKARLSGVRVVPVIGMMKDKAVSECASIYAEVFPVAVATRVNYPRAISVEALAACLREAGIEPIEESDPEKALQTALTLAAPDGVALVCGSLYLAGDMRLLLRDDHGDL